jgi:hypothetical protein
MPPRLSSENLLHNTIACPETVISNATRETLLRKIAVDRAAVSRQVAARFTRIFVEGKLSALIKRQSHAAKRSAFRAVSF